MMRKARWLGSLLLVATCTVQADIGRVKSSSGGAFVERGGQQLPATPGLPLEESDALVTGAGAAMSVTFVDNTRYSLGANSRIELSRFRFDPTTYEGSAETYVKRGSVAVVSGQIAKSGHDSMRMRTRSSVLGVRGTEFVVDVGQ